jgi:hypothetical protein
VVVDDGARVASKRIDANAIRGARRDEAVRDA